MILPSAGGFGWADGKSILALLVIKFPSPQSSTGLYRSENKSSAEWRRLSKALSFLFLPPFPNLESKKASLGQAGRLPRLPPPRIPNRDQTAHRRLPPGGRPFSARQASVPPAWRFTMKAEIDAQRHPFPPGEAIAVPGRVPGRERRARPPCRPPPRKIPPHAPLPPGLGRRGLSG